MTHAELLERYFEAKQALINAYSSSLASDTRKLFVEVNEYADENDIDFHVTIHPWYLEGE